MTDESFPLVDTTFSQNKNKNKKNSKSLNATALECLKTNIADTYGFEREDITIISEDKFKIQFKTKENDGEKNFDLFNQKNSEFFFTPTCKAIASINGPSITIDSYTAKDETSAKQFITNHYVSTHDFIIENPRSSCCNCM